MIIRLRRSIHSKAFKVIVWILLFAASGALSVFEFARSSFFATSNDWVLRVNNQKILSPQFIRAVHNSEEHIRMMRAQYGQYADLYFQMMGMKLDPAELAINDLTRKALLNEIADKLPLHIDEQTIRAHLNDIMFIQQELSDLVPLFAWDPSLNAINPVVLNTYLQRTGISTKEFNALMAQAVKRHDLGQLVELGSSVPSFEIKEQFKNNFLGHKFSIYTIPSSKILEMEKRSTVSDQMLKTYFDLANSQKNQYRVPEKRSGKMYTFDPLQYGITIEQAEIETYYNNNKALYIESPTQVQVRRILLKVENPAQENEIAQKAQELQKELAANPDSFAQKAKELSKDSASASKGGLLDYFTKGTYEKDFEKTAFLLAQDNDISQVIRTKDGYEIVQRVGKKQQTIKSLPTVSKEIKTILQKKEFSKKFAADVRTALANSEKLAAFIKEKNAKLATEKDLKLDESILAKTLFKLKENESSFYQTPQEGVIVTLMSVAPSFIPTLDSIKAQVTQDYHKEQANKKTIELAQEFKTNQSLYEKFEGRTYQKTGWLSQAPDQELSEKKKLTDLGLDLSKMFQLENIGSIAVSEHDGSLFVIRLDEVAPFDQELFDQKKDTVIKQLEQQKKSLAMAGFVASLYRNATINKNESLIRSE